MGGDGGVCIVEVVDIHMCATHVVGTEVHVQT